MSFQHPLLLLLLVPSAILFGIQLRRSASSFEKRRLPVLFVSIALLITAVANPYWSMTRQQRIFKGVDLVLLMDVSQSMFCRVEGDGTRIDQARNFLRTLLPQFSGSSISVVYFAGDAFLGSPSTTDLQAVYLFLDSISPRMTTKPGTFTQPLQNVLEELLNKRASVSGRKPLGLVFSDGEFFDKAEPLQRWVKRNDVSLATFLCGTGKTPVPKFDLAGNYKDAFSETQPGNLQKLAAAGGGRAYDLNRARPQFIAADLLRQVNETIEKGDLIPHYRYLPFAAISLVLLLIHQLLPLAHAATSRISPVAAMPLLVLMIATVAMTPAEKQRALFTEALKDTSAARYDQALKKLQLLQTDNQSTAVDIAIGNVYHFQKNYDRAIEAYKRALAKDRWNQEARWNWEVVLKQQSSNNQPPPTPPDSPQPQPPQVPDSAEALLKYSDQMEQQQLQQRNPKHAATSEFAW